VFHFARRVAFGVYVADFLEFKRAFERHGKVIAASQDKEKSCERKYSFEISSIESTSLKDFDVQRQFGELLA
jgi:hypothetical protein